MGKRGAAVLLVVLAGCGGAKEPRKVAPLDRQVAHAVLTKARAELAMQPGAAFRLGIVVTPFGVVPNADVQAFFNVSRGALGKCLEGEKDAAALDAVYVFTGKASALSVFDADMKERPAVAACVRKLIAGGPLAAPKRPGSIAFIPSALVAP